MRVLLLGPPGVGKGTQGRRLAAAHGWALISTGEMLREAATRGVPLGREAKRVMDAGRLVPDDVMIGLVRERSAQPDAAQGFVLDGFPRTVPQAEALEQVLSERGQRLDAAISLDACQDELVRRLGSRRECPVCKRAYNADSAVPRDGVHCDDHPEAVLVQRVDDATETIRHRLAIYEESTAPLIGWYRSRGRLYEVHGIGTMDEVSRAIGEVLAAVRAE
jgi:adenylate kinase